MRRMESDADADGLDWAAETFIHGTDPNNADSDGDGIPDAAELAAGLSPILADSDGDGVDDSPDRYPDDRRRSEDLPTLHYAPLDFTKAVFGEGHVGWLAAIDDDNRVGLLAAKYDAAWNIVEFKVTSWVLSHPLSEAQDAIRTLPIPHRLGDFQASYLPAGVNASGVVVGTMAIARFQNYPSASVSGQRFACLYLECGRRLDPAGELPDACRHQE